MSKDQRNVYICPSCAGQIVTIDREEGVTPFMLKCRAEDGCHNGMMQSCFYIVPDDCPEPQWEWYKPDKAEYDELDEYTRRDHVDRGGLLLRKIGEQGRMGRTQRGG